MSYNVSLPSYSVGTDVYKLVGSICAGYGHKAVAIGGHKAMAAVKDKLCKAIIDSDIEISDFIWYGGEASYENVENLMSLEAVRNADMLFAIGGGKATDTVKTLADMTGKPVFTFPTIASNCAACTSVSIMYNSDGTFLKPNFFVRPAMHAFIDTEIIAKAPVRYMWAGIGDTYAKYYEACISSRDERLEHFTALGVSISVMCQKPLLEYGAKAYEDHKKGLCTYEVEQVILAIVVTTGIASIFLTKDYTPDYNSGLAHAIFYALTSYPVIEKNHLHGEIVGFGVLLALLVDGQDEEFEKIYLLNKSISLPVSLDEIEISKEQWEESTDRIPDMSDVAHYPYKVTKEMLKNAMARLEEKVRKDNHVR